MPDDTYTPSTEQVKADWTNLMATTDEENGYTDPMDPAGADAAFDRFIARVKAEALRDAGRMLRAACDRWEVDGDAERLVADGIDPWIARTIEKEAGA